MNSCTICMKEEIKNEDIYITDCDHSFCKDCLDDWFQRGNQTCPLCRSYIDTYKYKDETYKLIIHTVERNTNINQINFNDLINHNIIVRNIVRKNIKLRFYGFSITFLFLYLLNNYFYALRNLNLLGNELNICNLNNTNLQDSLNQCKIMIPNADFPGPGYYVSMFNGEISRRCFYPLNFYNICFNK